MTGPRAVFSVHPSVPQCAPVCTQLPDLIPKPQTFPPLTTYMSPILLEIYQILAKIINPEIKAINKPKLGHQTISHLSI